MTRLSISKARDEFPDKVKRDTVGEERTVVSREEMDRIDIVDARASLREAEENGTVPLRELMRELGD